MTEVYKCATRYVESIMPAVWVLVLPGMLNPLKHKVEGVKQDFAIDQAFLVPIINRLCTPVLLTLS